MNFLAKKVICDKISLWVHLVDGRIIGVPLAYFPRLLHATVKQRKNYIISGGGRGLHWEEIDEDISVEHLILGIGDQGAVSKKYQDINSHQDQAAV